MNTGTTTIERIEAMLLNQKEIFNIDDFCRYTGLSKSATYKLTGNKQIRFSRPNGKLIFFRKDDVDAYLMSNPIMSTDDIEQEAINYTVAEPVKGGLRWS